MSIIRNLPPYLIFGTLCYYAACKSPINKLELSIKWTSEVDSILTDTSKQLSSADSLKRLIRSAKYDTVAIDLLNELSETINVQASLTLLDESYDQSDKIDYKRGKVTSIYERGFYYYRTRKNGIADSLFQASKVAAEEIGLRKIEALSLLRRGELKRYESQWDKATALIDEALKIANEINDRKIIAHCYYILGEVNRMQHLYDLAIDLYHAAIESATAVEDNSRLSLTYSVLANIYLVQGNIIMALQSQLKGLEYARKVENRMNESFALTVLGEVYRLDGQFDKAMECFSQGLKIAEDIKNEYRKAELYSAIGQIHIEKKEYDLAFDNYSQAAMVAHASGDANRESVSLAALGQIKKELKENSESISFLDSALMLNERINNPGNKAFILFNLSEVYYNLGDFRKSERYATESLELSKSSEVVEYIKVSSKLLASICETTQRPSEALSHYKLFVEMKDSMNNEEQVRKFAAVEYEAKAKELRIEQERKDAIAAERLKQKNQQRNAFIGGFVLMIGLAGVSYRSYLTKKKDNAIISKEKARSEELLLNILPAEVAEELKAKGEAEAQLIDHATVLFTDFKGFTQLSESLSPKELVADLNECFTAFDHICQKHGIEKIKTIGDAYMAAGGLPSPNPDHAQRVVRAALEMAVFVAEGKGRKIANGHPYFEIRIGVHTGPVVAGIVGIKKFQYDIWGDTVNTASRMESSGEVGRVNISETTYQLVKDHFTCEYRGEVEAKGKGKMGMYFILS